LKGLFEDNLMTAQKDKDKEQIIDSSQANVTAKKVPD
jgi:hypothetical protein